MKLLTISVSVFYLLGLKLSADVSQPASAAKTPAVEIRSVQEKKELMTPAPAPEISKKENQIKLPKDSTSVSSKINLKQKPEKGI